MTGAIRSNFSNLSPDLHDREHIKSIGSQNVGNSSGVLEEMANAFGHKLDDKLTPSNLGQLVGKVGSAKLLQDNISLVQQRLETNEDAVSVARDWIERSGLLLPVDRYFGVDEHRIEPSDLSIITGGVRNWMARRADLLVEECGEGRRPQTVLLVGGSRTMRTTEGSDVVEGMKESDYLEQIVKPTLDNQGLEVHVHAAGSSHGYEVMKEAAKTARDIVDINASIIRVVANAGNWPQNAGQFRRAAREIVPEFDSLALNLIVKSDSFPLGTGQESATTHQNPFSALGQIARNFYELAACMSER
ncbi:MAG: hypothetical protein WAQ24_03345 [Candidatus Saccharimonadales bacterium]